MPQNTNHFEDLLRTMEKSSDGGHFHKALIDVTDTAYACKVWLENYSSHFTAADVVAMTALVMKREKIFAKPPCVA